MKIASNIATNTHDFVEKQTFVKNKTTKNKINVVISHNSNMYSPRMKQATVFMVTTGLDGEHGI